MSFTEQQEREIERLMPIVEAYAARYDRRRGDEEYRSVANLALCQAVKSYDPERSSKLTIDQYVNLRVQNALNDTYTVETRELTVGLQGGAPTQATITASYGNGRRCVVNSMDLDNIPPLTRDMDLSLVAKGTRDVDADLHDMIEMLPARLQQIAYARWIDGDDVRTIARDEGMPFITVRRRLEEAEAFARLYVYGGAE